MGESMSQHTPGPWIAQEYQDGIRIIGRAVVAIVPNEQVADARLIAAAPEMYEFLGDFEEAAMQDFQGERRIMFLLNKVRALLAKVEGKG